MTTNVENKIKQTTEKTRVCPHCKEILENVTPLEFGRHVKLCPKNKKVIAKSPFLDITVNGIRQSHPKSELKAIRLKCLDCNVDSSHEVETCPVTDCPLWTHRFNMTPKTALRKGRNVAEN